MFIKRNELPASLRSAYDIAAKGTENDTSRPEGMKNNTSKIDSVNEVLIFEQEVEKAKVNDKLKYTEYRDITNYIKTFKDDYALEIDILTHFSGNAYDLNLRFSHPAELPRMGNYGLSNDMDYVESELKSEVDMLKAELNRYNDYNEKHPYLAAIKGFLGANKSPQEALNKAQKELDEFLDKKMQFELDCDRYAEKVKERRDSAAKQIDTFNHSW